MESDDRVWEPVARREFADLGAYMAFATEAAPSDSPESTWKGMYGKFATIDRRWRLMRPGTDVRNSSPRVSASNPVFGCSLFSIGRPDVADGNILRRDSYIAAGADSSLCIVRAGCDPVQLPIATASRQDQGVLGFGYDPRSRLAVTGGFDGSVRFHRINVEACETLSGVRAGTLRSLLRDQGVSAAGCVEKSDLIRRVQTSGALPAAQTVAEGEDRHQGTAVGVSVDGDLVATAANDGFVKLWRVGPDAGWETVAEEPAPDGVSSSSSSAGAAAASGAERRRRLRRRVTSLESLRSSGDLGVPTDSVCLRVTGSAEGSPGSAGKLALGDKAGRATVQDLETGSVTYQAVAASAAPTIGMPGWVWCVSLGSTLERYGEAAGAAAPLLPPSPGDESGAKGSAAAGLSSLGDGGSASRGVMYTGGTDGRIRVWDLRAPATRGAAHTFNAWQGDGGVSPIAGLDVRETQGTIVAGLFSGTMLVCDVRAGRARGVPADGGPSVVGAGALDAAVSLRARFSSETERFARVSLGPSSMAGGCFDGKCYVWDMGF